MKNQLNAMDNAVIKLTFKQKNFIYTIARLEYKIWKALTKLEIVNTFIAEEEANIVSLNAAISAAGKGKVAEKLIAWKTKAEYKLFKLNLRKNKIDVVKLIINQSKLEQTKQALIALETDIKKLNVQMPHFAKITTDNKPLQYSGIFNSKERFNDENHPINQSIKAYIKEHFQMAS